MYIANVTNDYDNITSSKHDNMAFTICTNRENNIEIVITSITIIPCGMSLICVKSLMVYTLVKPLSSKKQISDIKNVLINGNTYNYIDKHISIHI